MPKTPALIDPSAVPPDEIQRLYQGAAVQRGPLQRELKRHSREAERDERLRRAAALQADQQARAALRRQRLAAPRKPAFKPDPVRAHVRAHLFTK